MPNAARTRPTSQGPACCNIGPVRFRQLCNAAYSGTEIYCFENKVVSLLPLVAHPHFQSRSHPSSLSAQSAETLYTQRVLTRFIVLLFVWRAYRVKSFATSTVAICRPFCPFEPHSCISRVWWWRREFGDTPFKPILLCWTPKHICPPPNQCCPNTPKCYPNPFGFYSKPFNSLM